MKLINFLYEIIFPAENYNLLFFLVFTFLISGIIKGFLGIGLPAAAMALLTLVMEPKVAISLLTLPIIFTNVAQFFRSENKIQVMNEYKYFSLVLILSIFCVSIFINLYPTDFLTISIGIAMIVFVMNDLIGIKLKIDQKKIWQIIFGFIAGVLGGLSSIWSPPVAMYLIARGISKEKFIGTAGFLLLSGCFPLALGLIIAGVFTIESAIKSLFGLFFVLAGFSIGEFLRKNISQNLFKKFVLFAFLIMGIRLVFLGLL